MKVWAASVLAITLSSLAILVHAQSQQALQDAQAAIEAFLTEFKWKTP